MKEVINSATYSQCVRVANIELSEVGELLKGTSQFIWIGLHEPSEEMLGKVQKEFGLHDLAVKDAHRSHQRSKIEMYGDSLFVVMRTAQMNQQNHIEFGETHFFVGKNFIVTVRHGYSVSYADVRNKCENSPDLLKKGQAFALYAVMDFIVDQYFPVVNELEQNLINIEDKNFNEKTNEETTKLIYQMKRELLQVKQAVSPFVDICNRPMRFDIKYISEETQPHFRDVYDHSLRINDMVDNTRELLNTALDANFPLISISQSDVSKKFAAWAAIIALPTMVAGFNGINFKSMPELDWEYGYPVVVYCTFLAYAIIYYF